MSNPLLSPSFDPNYEFNAPKYYDFTAASPGVDENFFGHKYTGEVVPCTLQQEVERQEEQQEVYQPITRSARVKVEQPQPKPSVVLSAVQPFTRKRKSKSPDRAPPPVSKGPMRLTVPKSPGLSTKTRVRAIKDTMTTTEKEEARLQAARDALKKSVADNARRAAQCRALPVIPVATNTRTVSTVTSTQSNSHSALSHGVHKAPPLPAPFKPTLTRPEEFTLSTETRASKRRREQLHTTATMTTTTAPKPKWRAQLTKPEPFELFTDLRAASHPKPVQSTSTSNSTLPLRTQTEAFFKGCREEGSSSSSSSSSSRSNSMPRKREWTGQLTQPQEVALATTARATAKRQRTGDEPKIENYVSLQAQVNKFMQSGRSGPVTRSMSSTCSNGTMGMGGKPELTRPEPFEFFTDMRAKGREARDQAGREQPTQTSGRSGCSQGTRSNGDHSHPPSAPGLTVVEPFNLSTSRARSRHLGEATEIRQTRSRSRNVGSSAATAETAGASQAATTTATILEQHALTAPAHPSGLRAPLLAQLAKQKFGEKVVLEQQKAEELRQFHARPMPDFDKLNMVVEKSRVPLTTITSPGLASTRRAAQRKSFDIQLLANHQQHDLKQQQQTLANAEKENAGVTEMRKQMVHKALPWPNATSNASILPQTVPRARRELTVPQSPMLHTKIRALHHNPPTTPPRQPAAMH